MWGITLYCSSTEQKTLGNTPVFVMLSYPNETGLEIVNEIEKIVPSGVILESLDLTCPSFIYFSSIPET